MTTDTTGYPAALSFSAYVADFAVILGDALTLTIPDFSGNLFSVGGPPRKSPLAVLGKSEEIDVYDIILPAGYTKIEHLPESLLLSNPARPGEAWLTHDVSHRIENDRLCVTVRRCVRREHATQLSADYFPFLRDWNRRAASRACRTLIVRKTR